MTRALYHEDAYLRSCEAEVVEVDGEWVAFDRTIFYPLGGGQPGDRGQLLTPSGANLAIRDTRKGAVPGTIVHQVETAAHGLAPGARVQLELDWALRYRHMQMHTAMHLLGSLIPVPVTGGNVGAERSRLDFDLGEHQIDKDTLTEGLGRLIAEDHPVALESITDAELDAHPELVRTMSVQPPRGSGIVRMVRVVDVDYQPCGGTHVRRTGEIGPLVVAKIENKGRQNRRVHLAWAP